MKNTLNQQLLEVAYSTRDAWQKLIDRLTEEEADSEIIPLTKEAEKAMKEKDRKGKMELLKKYQ